MRLDIGISEHSGKCQGMTPTDSGLLEDMLHVNLHGASLDLKFLGDLPVRESLLDEFINLVLARSQCVAGVVFISGS